MADEWKTNGRRSAGDKIRKMTISEVMRIRRLPEIERVNEWVDERVNERVNERVDERVVEWIIERVVERIVERTEWIVE